jgi:hypothetical protein
MKRITWLVLCLVGFGCQPVIEDDNCYRWENQVNICNQIADNMRGDWKNCYTGGDQEQDEILRYAMTKIEEYCLQTECLPENAGLECAGQTWECTINSYGSEDLTIPLECSLAIEEL